MQVKELIEILKNYDQEADVHFAYGYGDHWRTQVAPAVSQVDEGLVAYSEYHRMDKIVEEDSYMDEEPGNPDENVRRVVVLG